MTDHLSNGENYTRISNEILEEIAKAKLNGTQYAICLVVWRYTFGFHRCEHDLSIGFISEATGLTSRAVKKELKNLIDKKVLLVTKENTNSQPRRLKFNKDCDQWVGNEKPPGEQSAPRGTNGSNSGEQKDPSVGNKKTPKKENSKENKENIYSLSVQKVFSVWNDQKIITHGFTEDINKAISTAIKNHGVDEVVLGIQRYSKIYHDPDFFFGYKWTLVNFLSRKKGLSDFLNGGEKWENYLARGQPKSKSKVPVDALGDPVPGGQDMTPI